jgi:hypothetical protein
MSPEHGAEAASVFPVAEPAGRTVQHEAVAASAGGTVLHEGVTAPKCDNCGAAVPAKYCSHCGQRFEHAIHSVLDFTREATEDLTHADSRLWSTIIALLFKPGFLTREFLSGRRVRYLPPLRLYLVLSVLFFLAIGTADPGPRVVRFSAGNGIPSVTLVSPDKTDVFAAKPGETLQQQQERLCKPEYDGPAPALVNRFLERDCRVFLEYSAGGRGHALSEAFIHNLSRAMFIFLPALALVMKVMYRRPRHYYVEHLLFFLHNHAFAFLVFALLTSMTRFLPSSIGNWLTLGVWLYVPYYLFVSMRQVYGQGRWLTFAKLVVLSFTYFAGTVMTLAVTTMYSLYAL